MECRSLRESGTQIGAFNAALFAITTDTVETNRAFAQSLGIDFPVLSDPKRKVAEAYGVATPGIARWTFYIGSDGNILYIDKAVMPSNHGKAIAAKLAELGVPKRRGR